MPSSLTELWLLGVAANTTAPSDVLPRLLHPAARTAWKAPCQERALPADVIDAVIGHPERSVRRAFAHSHHATQRSEADCSTTPTPSCVEPPPATRSYLSM